MRSPIILVWSPWSLAEVALDCSGISAALIGGSSAGIAAALFLGGIAWPMNEPFGSVGAYILDGFWVLLLISALFVPGGLVAASLIVFLSRGRRLSEKAMWRAFVLAPATVVIPALFWLPFRVIAATTDPSVGILGGTPAWTEWWPLRLAGSPWWPLVAAAFTLTLYVHAAAYIGSWGRTAGSATCMACGYDRRGLPADAKCPECGTPLRNEVSSRPGE